MFQLLIVDDEVLAVDGVKSGVDWREVGISRVFAAYSVAQAKEMFERERIDILLCDIEMPQGTGLQLLEWVRERYPKTETIFLTCHADFAFAKQAIQLGSLDYVLKPVPFAELADVIRRAANKVRQENQLSEFTQYGKYWFQYQPLLVEKFWLDIVNQTIPGNAEAVMRAAEERKIPFAGEMKFIPVLIRVRRWHKVISLREEKIMEYAFRNSAEELLLPGRENGLLLSLGNGTMLALLDGDAESSREDKLKEACKAYIAFCHRYFYCDLSCYIGDGVRGHEMASMLLRLTELDRNNVAYDNRVFLLHELRMAAKQGVLPDMSVWAVMLREGAQEKVLAEAETYMEQQANAGRLSPELLHQFIQDFQQTLYYVLQTKGIQAHQLLSDSESMELSVRSVRSATDLIAWIRHAVVKAMTYATSIEQSQSVVNRVIFYIKQHITEDFSRDDIANSVFLNPDYLTRVFKKETGMSISDYLLKERLGIAQELLAKTDMPVSAVAAQIGYSNFSHFSRMFKKYTDLNPIDYRMKQQNKQAALEGRQSDNEKS
ncbi:response regulator [Cohnella endophytica]|uniref:Response regulator n=1 Tax=Cohnella endophytica TaxID=2419778 RepID=A0A494Y1W1_9BACL|nr:response regulator [Cohnella endophytica]RKP56241.1 response regulator [Cohnella endophytica]